MQGKRETRTLKSPRVRPRRRVSSLALLPCSLSTIVHVTMRRCAHQDAVPTLRHATPSSAARRKLRSTASTKCDECAATTAARGAAAASCCSAHALVSSSRLSSAAGRARSHLVSIPPCQHECLLTTERRVREGAAAAPHLSQGQGLGLGLESGSGSGQGRPHTSSVRYSTSSGHTSQPSAPKLSRSRRTTAFHRSSRWPRDMTPAEGVRGCAASAVSAAAAAAWPRPASSAGTALYLGSCAVPRRGPASAAASASAPPPPPTPPPPGRRATLSRGIAWCTASSEGGAAPP
eukprot:scaffold36048_cov59-Phaeocystis_antarctica.AAC.3